MVRNKIFLAIAATGALTLAAPASAGGWNWGGHHHGPGCGHSGSSTSGGWSSSGGSSSSSGGSSSSSSSSGGSSTSSGGTQVPEPGMLGMFGAGLIGLGFARSRRRKAK